jgi:hypothetical protein
MNYAQPHVDWGNPIDLRADKALPRKSGRRPLVGRRKAREGRGFTYILYCDKIKKKTHTVVHQFSLDSKTYILHDSSSRVYSFF